MYKENRHKPMLKSYESGIRLSNYQNRHLLNRITNVEIQMQQLKVQVKGRSSSAPNDNRITTKKLSCNFQPAPLNPQKRNAFGDLSTNSVGYNNFSEALNKRSAVPTITINGHLTYSHSTKTRYEGYSSEARRTYVIPKKHAPSSYKRSSDEIYEVECGEYDDDVFIEGYEDISPARSKENQGCRKRTYVRDDNITFGNISPIRKNCLTAETTILLPSSVNMVKSFKNKKENKKNANTQWMPIDAYDREYLEDIMGYLSKIDLKYPITTRSMAESKRVSSEARACMIDWLLKVQYFSPWRSSDTYLRAIRIFDCILFNTEVPLNMYQLLSITCLFIITKFDCRGKGLSTKTVVALLGGAYTKKQFFAMERKVFKFINFSCTIPEPITFVEYYMKRMNLSNKTIRIGAYYLLEAFALCRYFSMFRSSKLAASALYLAMKHLAGDIRPWKQLFRYEESFPIAYMEDVLTNILRENCPYKGCYEKYLTEDNLFIPDSFISITA